MIQETSLLLGCKCLPPYSLHLPELWFRALVEKRERLLSKMTGSFFPIGFQQTLLTPLSHSMPLFSVFLFWCLSLNLLESCKVTLLPKTSSGNDWYDPKLQSSLTSIHISNLYLHGTGRAKEALASNLQRLLFRAPFLHSISFWVVHTWQSWHGIKQNHRTWNTVEWGCVQPSLNLETSKPYDLYELGSQSFFIKKLNNKTNHDESFAKSFCQSLSWKIFVVMLNHYYLAPNSNSPNMMQTKIQCPPGFEQWQLVLATPGVDLRNWTPANNDFDVFVFLCLTLLLWQWLLK